MIRQLPLHLQLDEPVTFEQFYPGGNQQALEALSAMLGEPRIDSKVAESDLAANAATHKSAAEQQLFLFGATDGGKSHLLKSAVRAAVEAGQTGFYLPLKMAHQFDASMLVDLAYVDVLCIDDVSAIAGDSCWEKSLFELFNRRRASNKALVFADRLAPASVLMELADLQSRLSWGLSLHIQPLSDEDKQQLLIERANARGIELPAEVASYLLRHLPRNLSAQLDWLNRFDLASLAATRQRITVPFVKQVLAQNF